MIRAISWSVLWLLGGAGVAGVLFWAFLNTSEASVFTLVLSAVLALAIYVVVSTALGGALSGWDSTWRRSPWRAAAISAAASVPPIVVFATAWWLVGRGIDWVLAHSGEISAWLIATFNWSESRRLLSGASLAGEWVRRVIVPFFAMVWFGQLLTRGWRPVVDRRTLRQSLSPLRLTLVTMVAVATLWAPITYGLYWMPGGLPPTWVEPAVAVVKFAVIALVAAIGFSLIIRMAAPLSGLGSTSSPS